MPEPSVEEFTIRVSRGEGEEPPRVTAEWRGSKYPGRVDVDRLRRDTLHTLVNMLRDNRLILPAELELLGQHLYTVLMGNWYSESSDGPGGLLRSAIAAESDRQEVTRRLLRVSLEISGDAGHGLSSLPWEYLYVRDPGYDTGFFLGKQMNFMLTRQLPRPRIPGQDSDARAEAGNRPLPPLRILFVVLAPTGFEVEYEAVLETLQKLATETDGTQFELRVLADDRLYNGDLVPEGERDGTVRSTFGLFQDATIDFDPHVIHIVGHGQYNSDASQRAFGQLNFPKLDRTANWVADHDLASSLRDIPSLRLVFLQACESAEATSNPYQVISGLAQWLAQRTPAVIAMHFQINSGLANEFARAFYGEMIKRSAIEVAMHAARRKLNTAGVAGDSSNSGFGLPVLYLRGSGALLTPLEVPRSSNDNLLEPRQPQIGRTLSSNLVGVAGSQAARPYIRSPGAEHPR